MAVDGTQRTVATRRESPPSTEAVRKLRRVFRRTYFVRFFEPSDRLEAKKSRQIWLCSTRRRISPSFRTASTPSRPSWSVPHGKRRVTLLQLRGRLHASRSRKQGAWNRSSWLD